MGPFSSHIAENLPGASKKQYQARPLVGPVKYRIDNHRSMKRRRRLRRLLLLRRRDRLVQRRARALPDVYLETADLIVLQPRNSGIPRGNKAPCCTIDFRMPKSSAAADSLRSGAEPADDNATP